jgi:hypothetical protein
MWCLQFDESLKVCGSGSIIQFTLGTVHFKIGLCLLHTMLSELEVEPTHDTSCTSISPNIQDKCIVRHNTLQLQLIIFCQR